MIVEFLSFGVKYGQVSDANIVFDVRNIKNPYWVEDLRPLNGYDMAVAQYIESFPETKEIVDEIIEYLEKHLLKVKTIKNRQIYRVGIYCTGGQHRSVYVVKRLKEHFKNTYDVRAKHRQMPELDD